ncbi:MAG: AzlC family ABC transporter permease [Synergistetes bacterium]|nr:AzlC family ABC transporter permease [Synergistota bacterium]
MTVFKKGLLCSIPIMLGYIPVAVTFGISATAVGLNKLEAILSSLLIFAGASQFAMISLIKHSFESAIIIPVLLNLRHLIYGCIISYRYDIKMPFLTAFGLTDEVFAVSANMSESEEFIWGLEVGAYVSWFLGTLIGVLGGELLLVKKDLANSLMFSLTILFFILLIPGFKDERKLSTLIGGVIALVFHCLGYTPLGVMCAGILTPFLVSKIKG